MTSAHEPDGLVASRYRLRQQIGAGGMATVYRADDEALGRTVALKLFHADLVGGADEGRQRAEVGLLAGLNHPALVTLFDAGRDERAGYLVMELVDGSDLRELLLRVPLDSRATAAIGADIASALAYIHARQVVHRDIKPANILLPADTSAPGSPTAKLADFGIARLIDSTRLTSTGTLIGTASFLSPEQAAGEPVGPATDVYSLALVLLEALTGVRAFPGTPAESGVGRLSRDPEVPVRLGPAWSGLLRQATARNPSERPDAAELASRLRALDGDSTLILPVAPGSDSTEQLSPADVPTQRLAPEQRIAPAATSAAPAAESGTSLGGRSRAVLLAAGAAVLIGVAAVVAGLGAPAQPEPEPTPATVQYPAFDGDLGAHLVQLQNSVAP
ncbi:hypothetical protein BH09ACT5_BH09ACT5_19720 [soil metagenome]